MAEQGAVADEPAPVPAAEAGQRSVPTPFLTKTYQLVDDPVVDDVIWWNEDGSTFVVWRPAKFARDLLPKYFKHNNFSSFVRQLDTDGFRKIVPDRWEFANDCFWRGEKPLLCDIHRRKVTPAASVTGMVTVAAAAMAATAIPMALSVSPVISGEEQVLSSSSFLLVPLAAGSPVPCQISPARLARPTATRATWAPPCCSSSSLWWPGASGLYRRPHGSSLCAGGQSSRQARAARAAAGREVRGRPGRAGGLVARAWGCHGTTARAFLPFLSEAQEMLSRGRCEAAPA